MARVIKIGIIGCGGIANGKHMPSLSKVADCEMVAFCDIVVECAKSPWQSTLQRRKRCWMPQSAPAKS